jgi:hypothetical protein
MVSCALQWHSFDGGLIRKTIKENEMLTSSKLSFFASIVSTTLIFLAPSASFAQYKSTPAGIDKPVKFLCSSVAVDGIDVNLGKLTLDGSKAEATVYLKDGSPVKLQGTNDVTVSGPGTRTTGMLIHNVTLESADGSTFIFSVIQGTAAFNDLNGLTLWGNGEFTLAGSKPATWLGECNPVVFQD